MGAVTVVAGRFNGATNNLNPQPLNHHLHIRLQLQHLYHHLTNLPHQPRYHHPHTRPQSLTGYPSQCPLFTKPQQESANLQTTRSSILPTTTHLHRQLDQGKVENSPLKWPNCPPCPAVTSSSQPTSILIFWQFSVGKMIS